MANNKVQLSDGTVLLDLTGDTVTPEKLMAGVTAHDAAGNPIVGSGTGDMEAAVYDPQGKRTDIFKYVDAAKPKMIAITLTAAGWNATAKTQTATVTGVLADETKQVIIPSPAKASMAAYYEAGIICTGQAANSLTFTCETVPTAALTVYVAIQGVD